MEVKDLGTIAGTGAMITSHFHELGLKVNLRDYFKKFNLKMIVESSRLLQSPRRLEVEGFSQHFVISEEIKETVINFHFSEKICSSRVLKLANCYPDYCLSKIIDIRFQDGQQNQPHGSSSRGAYLAILNLKKTSAMSKKKLDGSLLLLIDSKMKHTKILSFKENFNWELGQGLRCCRKSKIAGYQIQSDSIRLWPVQETPDDLNGFLVTLSQVKESESPLIQDFCIFCLTSKSKKIVLNDSKWEVMEELQQPGDIEKLRTQSLSPLTPICACLDSHGGLTLFRLSDRCGYQYFDLQQLIRRDLNKPQQGGFSSSPDCIRYEFKAVNARLLKEIKRLSGLSKDINELQLDEKDPGVVSEQGASQVEKIEVLVIFNQIKKGKKLNDLDLKSQHLAILHLERRSTATTEDQNPSQFTSESEGFKTIQMGCTKLFDFNEGEKVSYPKIRFSGLTQTYQILTESEQQATKEVQAHYLEVPSPANSDKNFIETTRMKLVALSTEISSSFGFYRDDSENDPDRRGKMNLAHFNQRGYLTLLDVDKLKENLRLLQIK